MFFEFCPIRHVEWKIESKKEYSLNYRMLIFDGEMTAEQAEIEPEQFCTNKPSKNPLPAAIFVPGTMGGWFWI